MQDRDFTSAMAMIGVGSYSISEAARLIKSSRLNVRRWMAGYTYRRGGETRTMPPLWVPQLPRDDEHVEIGFRDLIELRFIRAFTEAGVGLKAVRNCLEFAREVVVSDHPFSTQRFRTDGRTIFLESLKRLQDPELLDLKKRQFVFKRVIERTFKDLDIEDETVARWRPYRGKESIVIDPARAFGQPIAAKSGVPTVTLADAAEAEGGPERVAALFEVPIEVVRDAIRFEQSLQPV